MLKFSPQKTGICVIALTTVALCGVSGSITVQSQGQVRRANVQLRQASEVLAQYLGYMNAAEVAYLRYLNSSNNEELEAYLGAVVQMQALSNRLQNNLPNNVSSLDSLKVLSDQKIQRLEAVLQQRKKGVPEAEILQSIMPEVDRAASKVITTHVESLRSTLEGNILANSRSYENHATLNRALLAITWIASAVVAGVFIWARYTYIKEQQHRYEEIEQELLRDRALAKIKEQARAETISFLNHDFDNVMTAVISSSELLNRQELPPRAKRHVGVISRGCQDLQDYVQDIRFVLTENTELIFRDCDVVELAQSSLGSIAVQRFANNHCFNIQVSGTPRNIQAENNLLKRALMNLLANATKYSPNGGEVLLGIIFNGTVTVEVGDEGLGIPQSLLPTIFDPFQRGDNVGNISGTGLGLAFVKSCAIAHGGAIEVFSDAQSTCSGQQPHPQGDGACN